MYIVINKQRMLVRTIAPTEVFVKLGATSYAVFQHEGKTWLSTLTHENPVSVCASIQVDAKEKPVLNSIMGLPRQNPVRVLFDFVLHLYLPKHRPIDGPNELFVDSHQITGVFPSFVLADRVYFRGHVAESILAEGAAPSKHAIVVDPNTLVRLELIKKLPRDHPFHYAVEILM